MKRTFKSVALLIVLSVAAETYPQKPELQKNGK